MSFKSGKGKEDFVTFGQVLVSCFLLFLVFVLSYAYRLLACMRVESIFSSNSQE